jgi:hypothetical protein
MGVWTVEVQLHGFLTSSPGLTGGSWQYVCLPCSVLHAEITTKQIPGARTWLAPTMHRNGYFVTHNNITNVVCTTRQRKEVPSHSLINFLNGTNNGLAYTGTHVLSYWLTGLNHSLINWLTVHLQQTTIPRGDLPEWIGVDIFKRPNTISLFKT